MENFKENTWYKSESGLLYTVTNRGTVSSPNWNNVLTVKVESANGVPQSEANDLATELHQYLTTRASQTELDSLRRFKAYVDERLSEHGVEPNEEGSEEGRLDDLLAAYRMSVAGNAGLLDALRSATTPTPPAPVEAIEAYNALRKEVIRARASAATLLECVSRTNDKGLIYSYFEDIYKRLVAMPVEALPAPVEAGSGWVAVGERLPEVGRWMVSVRTDDGVEVHSLELDSQDQWIHDGEPTFCHGYYFEPTHWMPLPLAPAPTETREKGGSHE